jgi:hypothetical protein
MLYADKEYSSLTRPNGLKGADEGDFATSNQDHTLFENICKSTYCCADQKNDPRIPTSSFQSQLT